MATIREKKDYAKKRIRNVKNPVDPSNSENTKLWAIIEGSKWIAQGLVEWDPANFFPRSYSYEDGGGDFGGDFPSNWREEMSPYYVPKGPKAISSGAKIGGGPKFDSFLDFSGLTYDFSHLDFSAASFTPTPMQLTYIYRDSEWPAWND